MTWYTTTVEKVDQIEAALNELEGKLHTIFSVLVVSGRVVIVSKV